MHAVVVTVDIESDQAAEEGVKNLRENIAPGVAQSPGFVSGLWLARDEHGHGLSVVIFDNEAAANAGAEMARQTLSSDKTPRGVKLNSLAVREVAARA